eukprot:TRINITY_DN3246_c0_g1_i3.p1 TRINITY_DN3246_c0_g1~~TRINITY_DN3246_c0_g1_i3.p1  ORF type:complete len:381 (-),score=61.37 TRINITY_DN3246_c0_g1_i3:339-1481(-)
MVSIHSIICLAFHNSRNSSCFSTPDINTIHRNTLRITKKPTLYIMTVSLLILTLCLVNVSLCSMSNIYSVKVECLGWFFCDSESVSVDSIDVGSGKATAVSTVVKSETYDAVNGYHVSSAISTGRQNYYVTLTNATFGALYTVDTTTGKYQLVNIPPLYNKRELNNIQYEDSTNILIANYGEYLVTIDPVKGTISDIVTMWNDASLSSSDIVSYADGLYTVIVLSSANNDACYYYYSVNIAKKTVIPSVCFPQYQAGEIFGAYLPLFIYPIQSDIYLRLGTNSAGGDLSLVDTNTGNKTFYRLDIFTTSKTILMFTSFAGLGWTLSEEQLNTFVFDPSSNTLYLMAQNDNFDNVLGSVNINNYRTKTLSLPPDAKLSNWE